MISIRSLVLSLSTVRLGTSPGVGDEACAGHIDTSVRSSEGSSASACMCARVLQVPLDYCAVRTV